MNTSPPPGATKPSAVDPAGADGPDGAQLRRMPRKLPRSRRGWLRGLTALAILGGVAELVARYAIGLGDPPLSQADPQLEYLFKPDQNCRRLGRRVAYNHYSMRSDGFPLHKTDPNEIRVMVVGDSVVNGGVLTDQSELATELLKRKLSQSLGRPVVVGNISAGSWGPPNQLAYLNRYGLFDADVLVLVLSSHDYIDVPTFVPVVGIDPAFPERKPWSALADGFERYVWPRFRQAVHATVPAVKTPAKREDIEACLSAVREMIRLGHSHGAQVIVALHLCREERLAAPDEGHDYFVRESVNDGVAPVELGAAFEAARPGGGNLYLDNIHPSALGHALIADTLLPRIVAELRHPTTTPIRR